MSLEVNFSLLVISVPDFSLLSLSLSLCCSAGCHLALLEDVSGITISDSFAFDLLILSLVGLQRDFLLVPICWGALEKLLEQNVRGGSIKKWRSWNVGGKCYGRMLDKVWKKREELRCPHLGGRRWPDIRGLAKLPDHRL